VPEYSIEFGGKLAEVADLVVADGLDDPDARRTVLYLSLLSTEISLKAMLEKAGKPVKEIRRARHDLAQLLRDLDCCEIEAETTPGVTRLVPASRLRASIIKQGECEITIGDLIGTKAASQYPNEIRYGDRLHHFPPAAVAQMASKVVAFAGEHWQSLQTKTREGTADGTSARP
jgi:hypothetical protein